MWDATPFALSRTKASRPKLVGIVESAYFLYVDSGCN